MGAYRFAKYAGDSMHGGAHWHVYARRGGKLLGRVSTSGKVLTGSVPRSALKKLIGGTVFAAVMIALEPSALADGTIQRISSEWYEWERKKSNLYENAYSQFDPFKIRKPPYRPAEQQAYKEWLKKEPPAFTRNDPYKDDPCANK